MTNELANACVAIACGFIVGFVGMLALGAGLDVALIVIGILALLLAVKALVVWVVVVNAGDLVRRWRGVVMDELKPCPFCGNTEPVISGDTEEFVECGNQECRAFGPNGKTRADAIAAWNRREGN